MPKNKGLMGLREYARHRGCGLATVQDAIRANRIKTINYNNRDWINPKKADKSWKNLTNPALVRNKTEPEKIIGPSYAQSRAIREAYLARTAKLDFEIKIKNLVEIKEVKLKSFEQGRKTRDAILNIPPRIAHELAAETDPHKLEVKLTEELNKALIKIADEGFKIE